MCGIGGTTEGETDAVRINSALRRRGPDMQGNTRAGSITLCHRRLSIIDLSERGRQPLRYKEYTISFNGEIYNYQELAKEYFPKENLSQGSDTEVLIRLFAKYGIACFPMLRGMWAIALYNEKTNEILLATDRFGKKPIYYELKDTSAALGKTMLRFASEARALLRGGETIDQHALDQFLELGVIAAPRSMWNELRKLPPATWLRVALSTGRTEQGTYWQPRVSGYTGSYEHAITELGKLLDASVRYRMIADVPVGCFLSGGVDSSIVSAIAHAQKAERGDTLHTFSIGFDNPAFDESEYSTSVAESIGTTHHHETARLKDLLRVYSLLPQIYSEPFADSSALPTYLVSKLARKTVTVSLSGDGADELFGGYRTYNHARRLQLLNKSPLKPLLPKHLRGSAEDSYAGLLGAKNASVTFNDAFNPDHSIDWVQSLAKADIAHYLPADILVKVDRASMVHALEVRCPFLDHDVAEFGLSLPAKFKIAQPIPLMHFVNKRILKDAYRTQLPAVVFDRRKQGFSIPERELMQELGPRIIDWEALGRPVPRTTSGTQRAQPAKTYREYVLADWAAAYRQNDITKEISE